MTRSAADPDKFLLDFRKVFTLALLAGTALLGYGQYAGDGLTAVLGPILVMVLYLAIGIRHARSATMEEPFADSLYYLGFLFTLAALSASLLAYRTNEVEFNLLVGNFALALVTTIFGLAARILIINFRSSPVERNTLEEILDRQTAKLCRTAAQISRELEAVNRDIHESHKALMEDNRLRIESASKAIESLTDQAARSIQRITESASAGVTQSLGELRSRLEASEFPEDLFSRKLSTPLTRLANKLDEGGELLNEFENHHQALRTGLHATVDSLRSFDEQIEYAGHAMNALQQQVEIERDSRQKLVELARSMSEISISSTSLTRELALQTANSRQILNILETLTGQMKRIPAEVEVTTSAIRESTRTLIKSTTALASRSRTVRENLEGFADDFEPLRECFQEFDQFNGKIGQCAQSLGALLEMFESRSAALHALEHSGRQDQHTIRRNQEELQRSLADSGKSLK
ncbi:MAG: hypothetical protein ACU843_12440, partial [Gammaproteobacteria bacterium]